MLFKSFTDLTAQEFDDIYNRDIKKDMNISDTKVSKQKEDKDCVIRFFKLEQYTDFFCFWYIIVFT
jgi:hypothetical protein